MKKKIYDSIIFKLIAAISIIFILMLLVSMYLINRKQTLIMEEVLSDFQSQIPSYSRSMILFVDSSRIQSSTDFSLYLFFVMTCVIILGSISFALIIKRILAPLKNLQKKISMVDIDKPESFENMILIDNTSSEIVELSESFDKLLKKIYVDYKRQKDFSSNVAHELRTPIAVMKSQIDLFKQKQRSEDEKKLIRVLDNNVNKLNSLVDAILSLRKKSKLNVSNINLYSLIDEIILDLEDKAASRNIQIIQKAYDIKLITDDNLLQRLIFNIVDNAIKYNVDGDLVTISAKKDNSKTQILIADTGIGISEKDKESIFDLFFQVDESRGADGFGIGLSLSKTIADMIKAKITLMPNQPQGTKFIINLPNSL